MGEPFRFSLKDSSLIDVCHRAGSDREHNLGKIAKHEEEGLQDSTVLSPVVPTQVVEPVWWPKVTTREVRLDELPVKVKRHRRGASCFPFPFAW